MKEALIKKTQRVKVSELFAQQQHQKDPGEQQEGEHWVVNNVQLHKYP